MTIADFNVESITKWKVAISSDTGIRFTNVYSFTEIGAINYVQDHLLRNDDGPNCKFYATKVADLELNGGKKCEVWDSPAHFAVRK